MKDVNVVATTPEAAKRTILKVAEIYPDGVNRDTRFNVYVEQTKSMYRFQLVDANIVIPHSGWPHRGIVSPSAEFRTLYRLDNMRREKVLDSDVYLAS